MAQLARKNTDAPTSIREATLKNASALAKEFGISAIRFNQILEELGYMEKTKRGWEPTSFGCKIGGTSHFVTRKGKKEYFTKWPETIIRIDALLEKIEGSTKFKVVKNNKNKEFNFRKKFPAEHRTSDGHFVRSKAEMIIDNWLYNNGIVHAYEYRVPIEEDMYCDFYIPQARLYIEYWGYENKEKYLERKKEKIALYEKYGLSLLELEDKDVQNLDDVLPKLLLKYGIKSNR